MSTTKSAVILPRSGDEMFLLVDSDSQHIIAFQYDGSNWISANDGGEEDWFTFTGGIRVGRVHAMKVVGNGVYVGGFFLDGVGSNEGNGIITGMEAHGKL